MKKVMLVIALVISYLVNAQGLQAVKKYDLPVHVKETDTYTVDLSPSGNFYIIKPKRFVGGVVTVTSRYMISYQDYQDVISFFYELIEAEPNPINYDYEIEGDNWYISIHKDSNNYYSGYMGIKHNGKKETSTRIDPLDVKFLSSLPLDLEE